MTLTDEKVKKTILELSYDEHVSLLIELGMSAEEAKETASRVRKSLNTHDMNEDISSDEDIPSKPIPQYHGQDKYNESVICNLKVSARSDMGSCPYQEDDIFYRAVNGKVVVACFDGHGGTCVNKAMDIFKAHCHEMTQFSDKKKIMAWFQKTFVEPLQNEHNGVCVLMGVVNSQGGWFLNLGDCRLYVDGIPKTKDSNVSSMSEYDRKVFDTKLQKINCGANSTHLFRRDGCVTHYLAVTASLGDCDWNHVLCRIPELVFVNKFNRISMMTDGVTEYLNDNIIARLTTANEIVGEVYVAAFPMQPKPKYKCWLDPKDNTSAIVISK